MGRTALVTGGTSGIGLALVKALVARGDQVLTCGSRAAAPPELRDLDAVSYRSCDLSSADGLQDLVDWVRFSAPQLDLLVNNAGIQNECRIDPDLTFEQIAKEVDTNLTAPMALCAALVPQLRRASGCIVNISSGLAIAPKAASPIYCATKAGLSSFSLTLRYQMEAENIRVVDVLTPLVKTPMTDGRHDGALEPDRFVSEMLRQVERGADEVYVGKARLLPILMRLAPGLARRIMRSA